MPLPVLNASRNSDSTTSLSSLFRCLITPSGKKFLLRRKFLLILLPPFPLVGWCSPPDEPVPCVVHVAGLGTGAPIIESPYGDPVNPEDAPESISRAVASLPPEQMFELMKQMKVRAGGPCSLFEHSSSHHCLHPPTHVIPCQSSDQCLSPQLCVQNSPQEARNMLLQNPQLAYALLQAQVVMRIVDPEIALVCPLLLVQG